MMMIRVAASPHRRSWLQVVVRSNSSSGPLAKDGRHEVWREGIYDHDK
jgi:hypothetical protein